MEIETQDTNTAAIPPAEMTPEEKKRADNARRQRAYRQRHKASPVLEFWQGVEQLRQWSDSMFGFDIAEYQYVATAVAVLLVECSKYADGKPNAIGSEEDFVAIAYDILDFAAYWYILVECLATKAGRVTKVTPPKRGGRIVSEWSALMEAGLLGDYLTKAQAKLQSLGYPTGPDPEMSETSIVYYLVDPKTRCADFAALLVQKAKQCVYKPYEGSKVDSEELSNKEIRELLRELEIVTPAVVDALLGQAPEVSRGTGLPINGELFEYGAPFLLAAAQHDMSPAFYQKMQGILNKSKAPAARTGGHQPQARSRLKSATGVAEQPSSIQ
jgi:hypothetical protein